MAVTRKSASTEVDQFCQRFTQRCASTLRRSPRVAVAISGGLDSAVLLHLLHRLRAAMPFELSVCHVHHGLSPHADAWLAHCEAQAAQLGLPFSSVRVDLSQVHGEGLEARARAARYDFYAQLDVEFVALAHHRDDQAETMLYRLFRGAGVHGAAGMPVSRPLRGNSRVWRPLLAESREAIRQYALHHNLTWVEDESNERDIYDRNFLRQRVIPIVQSRFPAASQVLARAAEHFSDAAKLLDELAEQDAAGARIRLPLARFQSLNDARQRNMLRWFLAQHAIHPDTAQLHTLLTQLLSARDDRMPCLRLGDFELRRHRDELWVALHMDSAPLACDVSNGVDQAPHAWLGRLVWQRKLGGIAPVLVGDMVMRVREGGEALRIHRGGPARTVKNLFQEAGIPPWLRLRWPLLWYGDQLVAVPGVAVAAEVQSDNGYWPRWCPDDWLDAP